MQAASTSHTKSRKCKYSQCWVKARLNTEDTEGSRLVAARHMTDQMSRQWSYTWAIYEQ